MAITHYMLNKYLLKYSHNIYHLFNEAPLLSHLLGHILFFAQFSSVQSLSRVRLFATPWIAAHQASLSITNSESLPKPTSIKLVMPSCEVARVNTMTGGLDLSFGFPWNGKIPHPHQVPWSQTINMHPVRNKGRAEKPAKVCTNKIALQTCNQSA